jgi:hypothetical protein
MKLLWLLGLLIFSGFQAWTIGLDLRDFWRNAIARDDIKRFARATRTFSTQPTGDQLWKLLGRNEPLRDPWDRPYRLESPEKGIFLWRSAGKDRVYQTADDIILSLPFEEPPPPISPNTPVSKDAI